MSRAAFARRLLRRIVPGFASLERTLETRTRERDEAVARQEATDIENARLVGDLRRRTADLQESLDYQTATSDVLKVISRSTFDVEAVLQTVMANAVRLCHADYGDVFLADGDEYYCAAVLALVPEYARRERDTRVRPGAGTLVGRAVAQGCTVQIPDAWNDPLYELKDDARAGNVRSMLGVPLLHEDAVIGVIGLGRAAVEPYSEREVQLVTTFADQAVIAIETARLLTELRESLDFQTATGDVLKVISRATLDLDAVLQTVVTNAVRLCHADLCRHLRE